MDQALKELLAMSNLYGLSAKKYEYIAPQQHVYNDQLHFQYANQVEQHCRMMEKPYLGLHYGTYSNKQAAL